MSRSGTVFEWSASVRDGAVRLISRNGHSFTRLFGPVSDALRAFPVSILLDGEVIVINDKGQPDFEALQAPAWVNLAEPFGSGGFEEPRQKEARLNA